MSEVDELKVRSIPLEHRQLFKMCWVPALGLLVSSSELLITMVY